MRDIAMTGIAMEDMPTLASVAAAALVGVAAAVGASNREARV